MFKNFLSRTTQYTMRRYTNNFIYNTTNHMTRYIHDKSTTDKDKQPQKDNKKDNITNKYIKNIYKKKDDKDTIIKYVIGNTEDKNEIIKTI